MSLFAKKKSMEGPHPTDARESRIWNWLNKQDEFYPVRRWPGWARYVVMKKDKGNKDRFELYRWLVVNGCNPETAGTWSSMQDAVPGAILGVPHVVVDMRPKVLQHLNQMETQYLTDDPKFFNNARILVLGAGDAGQDRVVYLDQWLKQRN